MDQYFAGLIDGEGCIGLHSAGRGKKRRIAVKVNMTCEQTVRALHDRYGGQFRKRKLVCGNKQQWEWRCINKEAVDVLTKIRPFVITKRKVIESLINSQGAP